MDFGHKESIYNLIQKPEEPEEKKPMHKSKYPGTLPPTNSTFGLKNTTKTLFNLGGDYDHQDASGNHKIIRVNATIGAIKGESVTPDNYLKKTEKSLPVPSKFEYNDRRKPAVPKKDEKPLMGIITEKNYVVSNAIDNIVAVPKQPKEGAVNYLKKSEFGKVPAYLKRIKNEIEKEYEFVRTMQEAQRKQNEASGRLRMMTDEERNELVKGLKENWEKAHLKYQLLPFTIDTPAKKRRKQDLEARMEAIERDLERLSKKHVYIYDDSEEM